MGENQPAQAPASADGRVQNAESQAPTIQPSVVSHRCHLCPRTFGRNGNLLRHLLKAHGEGSAKPAKRGKGRPKLNRQSPIGNRQSVSCLQDAFSAMTQIVEGYAAIAEQALDAAEAVHAGLKPLRLRYIQIRHRLTKMEKQTRLFRLVDNSDDKPGIPGDEE